MMAKCRGTSTPCITYIYIYAISTYICVYIYMYLGYLELKVCLGQDMKLYLCWDSTGEEVINDQANSVSVTTTANINSETAGMPA